MSLREALDKLFEDSFIRPLVPSGGDVGGPLDRRDLRDRSFGLPLSVDPTKIEATF